MALVAHGPRVTALNVLDTRIMHFLGRVSFSLYLLHPLTLIVLWHIPGSTAIPAAIFRQYIERPGISAGRLLLSQPWVDHRQCRVCEHTAAK